MLISILKSIWLEMTTVWLWFVKKVQRNIPTKQIFHFVTQSKFDELVWNFDKNIIWNNLHIFVQNSKLIFSARTTLTYFFSKRGFRLCVCFLGSHYIFKDKFENGSWKAIRTLFVRSTLVSLRELNGSCWPNKFTKIKTDLTAHTLLRYICEPSLNTHKKKLYSFFPSIFLTDFGTIYCRKVYIFGARSSP